LLAIEFQLPSFAEQTAIAETLSDSDNYVAEINALISKKLDKGAAIIQQLLAGTVRMPSFVDEWETITLGEIASFSKGQGLSKKLLSESGTRSCLLYGELFTTYGRVIESVVSRTNSFEGAMSRFGDVLLPGSTTTTGADLATASALLLDDVQLSGDVNIIRPDLTRVNPIYLAYHLTVAQREAIAMRTQGITIHHLYGKHLADLDVRLPSLEEQSVIAEVLTELQLEVKALETKRSKAEMIKQGMTSDLLSGKVRLT
jgi:type I restriction enzyme S subunit